MLTKKRSDSECWFIRTYTKLLKVSNLRKTKNKLFTLVTMYMYIGVLIEIQM